MLFNLDVKNEEIRLVLEEITGEDPVRGFKPAYHFGIYNPEGMRVGICDLRIGHNEFLYYGGNIGYRVFEPYRGNHYAEKACRLLFKIAKNNHLGYIYITCNPDNIPSKRTCENLGGRLIEIATLPPDNEMRERGDAEKCIFKWDL